MSSCLSGGGNTAAYGISLDIIKSPSPTSSRTTTTTMTSHSSSSSSPSSTLSESSNSQLAISTRKARTPRKRPNQTYSEAAALLSTAYPNIFSVTTDLNKPCKFIKPHDYSSFEDSSDDQLLLMPFAPHNDNRPSAFQIDSTTTTTTACSYLRHEYVSHQISHVFEDGYGDFDTESILDEETEEGAIDSIMGNNKEETTDDSSGNGNGNSDFCYGYPLGLGLGFDIGFGMIRGGLASSNPFRQNDQGDWWKFPAVNVGEISPTLNQAPEKKKKKKKKKLMRLINALTTSPAPEAKGAVCSVTKQQEDSKSSLTSTKNNSVPVAKSKSKGGNGMLLLKLNYDAVLDAWSDKSSVFSEDLTSSEFTGTDAALARLSQIDLFGESGALREASVQRYKEKRRTRLFSKKIRYQVRKVNADQRPRMKGRFVRRLNSPDCEEET